MIMVAMYMKVEPENRKELSQAITSLVNPIRAEKGCMGCDFFHGMEDENFFCLVNEWKTLENSTKHRESQCYKVLQGAMHLLEEPCEIFLYQRLQPAEKIQRNGLEIQHEK